MLIRSGQLRRIAKRLDWTRTVWCTTAAQQKRLAQVQTWILRWIVRLPCAVADDVTTNRRHCFSTSLTSSLKLSQLAPDEERVRA